MSEKTLATLIRAALSASCLITAADDNVFSEGMQTIVGILKECLDVDIEPDVILPLLKEALEIQKENHFDRIQQAGHLTIGDRLNILRVVLSMSLSDGVITHRKLLCLSDIASALQLGRFEGGASAVNHCNVQTLHAPLAMTAGAAVDMYNRIVLQARADQPGRTSGATIEQLAKTIDLIDPKLRMGSSKNVSTPTVCLSNIASMKLHDSLRKLRELSGFPNHIFTEQGFASYSPDGQKILTLSNSPSFSGSLSVWHSDTGTREATIELGEIEPAFCRFSYDGTRIISHADEAQEYHDGFRVWDAQTGELMTHIGAETRYYELVLSKSKPHVAALLNSCDLVHIWNYETGELLYEIQLENCSLPSADFSPDGSSLLVAQEYDRPIIIWDTATGHEKWRSATDYMWGMFSPDGLLIVAISNQREVDLLDTVSGCKVATINHQGACDAAFSADGRNLYTRSIDSNELRIWNTSTLNLMHVFAGGHGFRSPAFSPDSTQIITLEGSVARLRDLETGKVLRQFDFGEGYTTQALFKPDGRQALVVSVERHRSSAVTTSVWNLEGRTVPASLSLFSDEALFVTSQAVALLLAPPLEGSSPGEKFMQSMMVPIEERRLIVGLQGECAIWPAGEEAVFHSLLCLRERMGSISEAHMPIILDDPARDLQFRQCLAEMIFSSLLASIRHLEISGERESARLRIQEIIGKLSVFLSDAELQEFAGALTKKSRTANAHQEFN